ncbi:MAG TPA: hypothetical protein VFQ72_03605 [Candidatus Paceibacterota bacterium]|nr:hypothetical protein [Candidatus Paceibacterota bacterium]
MNTPDTPPAAKLLEELRMIEFRLRDYISEESRRKKLEKERDRLKAEIVRSQGS